MLLGCPVLGRGLVTSCSASSQRSPQGPRLVTPTASQYTRNLQGQNREPGRDFLTSETCLIGPAQRIMVCHHYWVLKLSEDTFYGVGERATNKEMPEAGEEAAPNKSGRVAHRVVRLEILAPLLSSGSTSCPASKCSYHTNRRPLAFLVTQDFPQLTHTRANQI